MGNMTQMQDGTGTTSWAYDGRGLKVQESKSGFAITYAYSDAGRLINRTDWTGSGASFSYDAAGRLVSFVDAVGETSYTYDADGNLVRQVNVNGTVEEISYDAAGQVTEIVHKRSNGQVLGYLSYGYNEDGLVSDVVEGDGSVVTYNYDPLFRLVSEQRVGSYAYTVSYEYDGAGNRLAKVWDGQRTDYVYDAADRLQFYVKPDGSVVAYDWDANGNMIARTEGNQTTEFEYDYDNRLVRIIYPNGSEVRFGYDGLGRRVFRQEGANVRYFYFDGDRIIAEREGSSWVVRYLLGLKPCGHVVSGQVRVYHADRLGSVRWVTDGSGNLVASYVYEGFGKIVGQEGSEVVPYRFCGLWGYRNDGDAGLLHVGARYYEVETGRWVQKDKMLGYTLSPITLNYYVYCNSDPINHIDPLGYTAWWPVVLVIGLVIGVAIVVAVYVYYRTRDKGTAVEAGATVPGYAVPGSELTGPVQAAPDIARIKHIDNAGTTNQLSSPNVEYTHEFDRILEQRDRRATIHYKAIHQMSQR
jgi:RHS repeat-associated protein